MSYKGSKLNYFSYKKISEIKSTTATAKAAFNKKKTLFTSKVDLNLRKKLVSATFGAQLCMVLKAEHFGK
jgi:hypothetical protein